MLLIPAKIDASGFAIDELMLSAYTANLPQGEYAVSIRPKATITERQRSFYRGVILPQMALKAAGGSFTAQQWHVILSSSFLTHEVEIDGLIYSLPKSTAQGGGVSKQEFSEYIDTCLARAAEHGVVINARP